MMHAKKAYESQRLLAWTRVDMVLALYDSALASVQAAIEAVQQQQNEAAEMHRQKAIRVIHGLAAGLDTSQGEIPQQMLRLFEFLHHSLGQLSVENLTAVQQVLKTLREAFQAIREEAAQLERDGKLPPLDLHSTVQVTV